MRIIMSGFVLCAALGAGSLVRAQDKGESAAPKAVEKVVRTYLEYQGRVAKHERLLDLCVEGATHSVFDQEDMSASATGKTVAERIKAWKELDLKEDNPNFVDAVRVTLCGDGKRLAVAFVHFHTAEVKCRDVFTLTRASKQWKVVSVVQLNRPSR
jgi:hypothetical protein